MEIIIYGMGYVGCVSAACLAQAGHNVVGVELDRSKIETINAGKSPFVEPGLDKAISEMRATRRLNVVSQDELDSPAADVSIVCVGTPSKENGSIDLEAVTRVVKGIGVSLKANPGYSVVSIRSTVLPGTTRNLLIPLLEQASGKRAGEDFGVCMNPEFLREGTAIKDFYDPPFTIIGEFASKDGDVVAQVYDDIPAPTVRASIESAEMTKYASNAFHAVKVVFANEIGQLCKKLGIDSNEVMDIVRSDKKLNISPAYLKPGFAFGGSCLPKDLRAILHRAKELDVRLPLLEAVLPSNRLPIDSAFNLIMRSGKKAVGVFGLSFKAGTDDLRESPMIELVERLLGKGYDIGVFDSEVSLARLHGSNKRYLDVTIPHITSLMRDSAEELAQWSEVIVLGQSAALPANTIANVQNKIVVDLVRAAKAEDIHETSSYRGIAW
jgi:GDP-mannose 6-dehydrogenase